MITKEEALKIWKKLELGVITNKFEWSDTEHEALQLLNDLLPYINQQTTSKEVEEAYKRIIKEIDLCDRDLAQGEQLVNDINFIRQALHNNVREIRISELPITDRTVEEDYTNNKVTFTSQPQPSNNVSEDKYKNKVFDIQELLDLTPKDIRDVATFTWKELNEIFNNE